MSFFDGLIEGELVGEASEDPAEGTNYHVGTCQRGRHHDYMLTVFEGEKTHRDCQNDFEKYQGPNRVDSKHLAEYGIDDCSKDETENSISIDLHAPIKNIDRLTSLVMP